MLIFVASQAAHWGVAIKTFDTKVECFAALDEQAPTMKRKYPQSLMWCAEPIGYSGG